MKCEGGAPSDLVAVQQIAARILTEMADLNKEAAALAAKIQENFEELGV